MIRLESGSSEAAKTNCRLTCKGAKRRWKTKEEKTVWSWYEQSSHHYYHYSLPLCLLERSLSSWKQKKSRVISCLCQVWSNLITLTQTHEHVCAQTHAHTHTCTHMHAHNTLWGCMCTDTHRAHILYYVLARAHKTPTQDTMHTFSHKQSRTCMHARIHMQTHTHTHTHTHTPHTHSVTCTHYTHTLVNIRQRWTTVKFSERECVWGGGGGGGGCGSVEEGGGGNRNFPGEKIKDSKRVVIPCWVWTSCVLVSCVGH